MPKESNRSGHHHQKRDLTERERAEAVETRARRHLLILYIVMALFIALPFILFYYFLGRDL